MRVALDRGDPRARTHARIDTMTRAFEEAWLSDDPLDELDDEELFGRAHLIERIIEVLGRVRGQSTSSTVALVGAWGSGKTTVLNGLSRRLSEPGDSTRRALDGEQWRVAEFNPWMYSGALDLHVGFFQALRDALPRDAQWNDRKDRLLKFGHGAAPLAGLAGLVGVDGERVFRQLLDAASDSLIQQRDKIESALREAKQPVLVIIDDLDRLTADELLHVFKLVRLVGRLPHVYYLLSYDEHTIVDLLAKTDLVAADDDRRALDYLEKIVQVRLDMPLLRHPDIDQVVDRAISHVAAQHHVTITPQQRQRLTNAFDEVLTERLRSPRALKRVFGQIDAFLGALGEEVAFDDFFLLTWLRTMEPGVYALIQRHQKELLGTSIFSLRDVHEPKQTSEQFRTEWVQRLQRAHVADTDVEDVFYLLQLLFPALEPVYRRADLSRHESYRSPEPEPGRIHHRDYFDRYFAFGVPADDIADQAVRDGVVDIAGSHNDTEAATALAMVMASQPELAVRKIWQYTDAAEVASEQLVAWVQEHWHTVERESMVSSRIEGLAASLVLRMPELRVQALARQLASTAANARFMATLVHAVDGWQYNPRDDPQRREATKAALLRTLDPVFRQLLLSAAAAAESPYDIDDDLRSVVLFWRLHSPAAVRETLQEMMTNGVDPLDLIGWLLPVTTTTTGEEQLSNFGDLSYITDAFDMTFLEAHVDEELPVIGSMTPFYDMQATRDARRKAALNLIRLGQMSNE